MHSIAIASLLAAAAALTSAAPFTADANANQPRSSYYVCNNNGFRGDCSVDPCAIPWCPDYALNSYVPVGSTEPLPPVVVDPVVTPAATSVDRTVCPSGTGFFQSCSNGFRGCCKGDACGSSWCPDYKPFTYEPINTWRRVVRAREPATDPTVCSAGTGFFQSCSNGFRGCCKSDACGSSWCPDYKTGTYEPFGAPETTTTTQPAEVPAPKPVYADCAPGTGYFQSCSNGFRGCCKSDACTLGYCPAY